MKLFPALRTLTLFFTGSAYAADEFLGPWASGEKEVLKITKDGESFAAEFIRENVKFEFEKVTYPAAVKDGALVISGDQGPVTAKYDEGKNLLVIAGIKAFQKLTAQQADALIKELEKK